MSGNGKGSGVLHPRGNLCPAPSGEEASCMGGDAVGEKNGSGFLSGGHRSDPRPAGCTFRALDQPIYEEGRGAAAYPAVDEEQKKQFTYPIFTVGFGGEALKTLHRIRWPNNLRYIYRRLFR